MDEDEPEVTKAAFLLAKCDRDMTNVGLDEELKTVKEQGSLYAGLTRRELRQSSKEVVSAPEEGETAPKQRPSVEVLTDLGISDKLRQDTSAIDLEPKNVKASKDIGMMEELAYQETFMTPLKSGTDITSPGIDRRSKKGKKAKATDEAEVADHVVSISWTRNKCM